jgi:hypothetical protein
LTVAYLSSDRGGEFFNHELTSFLQENGILHQSAPGIHPGVQCSTRANE